MARLIKDTKAAAEIAALDAFFETLAAKPERALYGPAHVFAAHELGAIDTLLIADGLFRCADAAARRRWVLLTEEVEAGGGAARVFSSAHESAEAARRAHGRGRDAAVPAARLVDAELPPIEGMAARSPSTRTPERVSEIEKKNYRRTLLSNPNAPCFSSDG